MELIRLLLLRVEGESDTDLSKYDNATLWYHRNLLIEANYAVGAKAQASNNVIVVHELSRLTWEGHEFLDAIRDQRVWDSLKKKFDGFRTSFTFPLLKDVAVSIIRQSILG